LRRLRLSFLGVLLAIAAALVPGAAVFAQPETPTCVRLQRSFEEHVQDARLIVIGRVSGDGENQVTIEPEAYLKGAAAGGPIRLVNTLYGSTCEWAKFSASGRVLAMLDGSSGHLAWPEPSAVFELRDGQAFSAGTGPTGEADLIARVRSLTNQYAVPANSSGEGAGIDWKGTILPVGAALVAIMVISLFLMRIWHRIDPS
jgi:hypothetical protein